MKITTDKCAYLNEVINIQEMGPLIKAKQEGGKEGKVSLIKFQEENKKICFKI